MSKEGSVAPKERVNIRYESKTGNVSEQKELPLRVLMLGDYTGRADATPLEDRKPINVDKANFNDVMAAQSLSVDLSVPDKLSEQKDASLAVKLKFEGLKDMTPEGVVSQVPELKQLLELRVALNALKSPLGNLPVFRKKLEAILGDDSKRAALMAELGLDKK